MNLVTREHLERWADIPSSKSTLPYLISRLTRATTPTSTKVDIPWGSATYIGGVERLMCQNIFLYGSCPSLLVEKKVFCQLIIT